MNSVYESLDLNRLPKHVAIIMDGNGRWAKKRFLPRFEGHRNAVKSVRTIVEVSAELHLTALTLYAFSTENWKRPQKEVSILMELFSEYLHKELSTLRKNNVKFQILGDPTALPEFIDGPLEKTIKETANNTGLILNLAMNYGGRTEILRAVNTLIQEATLNSELQVTEELFSEKLYTHSIPDPDLIIRTSGELRISNFLLWQAAYSEFYFTDTLWPDFSKEEYYRALYEFQQRERRMGNTEEE